MRRTSPPVALIVIILIASSLFSVPSFGQIGKKFREKTKKISASLRDPTKFMMDESMNALKKSKAKFDSSSFGFAISLSDNAGLYENKELMSDVRDGILLVFDRSSEKEPVDIANNYKDAGEMAYAANEYNYAQVSFELSRITFEANNLNDHVNYAGVIADQGLLNHTMGRYEKARLYTNQALELRKKLYGEQSMAYAASLNNLAVLKKDAGEFTEAQNTIDLVLSTVEGLEQVNTLAYAIMLNNKAMLYKQLGRYDEADKLLGTSLKISSGLQSEKSSTHQRLMTNQAILMQEMGNYEESEKIFLEVIDIKEKRLGKRHPDYAHMLNNLAALYVLMGKDDQVEELLLTAMDIYDRKFGTNHPSYASSVANLGNFYRYKDRDEESARLLKEALYIRKNVLGESHPDYVHSLEDMAMYYWKVEDWDKATENFEKAIDQTLVYIESFFPAMSEEEKSKYWNTMRPRFFRYFAYATQAYKTNPSIAINLLEYRIASKGILLSTSQKIRSSILNSEDLELISEYLEWIDIKETLAGYYTYSKKELADQNINLDSLESRANTKERYLSEHSEAFAEGIFKKIPGFSQVKESLSADEIALEILQIPVYDRVLTDVTDYYSLVIKDNSTHPELIKLGTSKELDDKYFKYYRNSIRLKSDDKFSYDMFFKPLEVSVANARLLFVSGDGIYNQVNLKTLLSDKGFVIDRWDIVLLTNIGDLPENKNRFLEISNNAIWLLGDPNYGESTDILPLPGTKKEVEEINQILTSAGIQTILNLNDQASEKNVKQASNFPVYHFATHGFFLADPQGLPQEQLFGIEPDVAKDNPMLRAGIMLAGAAYTYHGLDSKELSDQNNGILTAYEAMNLHLEKTGLVVLSACETGLGDVKAGEGVYGLQRAFLVAGAQRVIMSLWKVSDEATSQLMSSFYSNLINYDYDVRRAFQASQLALKEKYPEPYFWGAFVLVEK